MSERLRKRIDALRIEYVKTFEEEVTGFQAELSAGDQHGVARRAHRIGGTAGSYQLDAVCTAAQNVERLFESQDGEVLAPARKQGGLNQGSLNQGSLNQGSLEQRVLEQRVDELCEALRATQLVFLQATT